MRFLLSTFCVIFQTFTHICASYERSEFSSRSNAYKEKSYYNRVFSREAVPEGLSIVPSPLSFHAGDPELKDSHAAPTPRPGVSWAAAVDRRAMPPPPPPASGPRMPAPPRDLPKDEKADEGGAGAGGEAEAGDEADDATDDPAAPALGGKGLSKKERKRLKQQRKRARRKARLRARGEAAAS